MKKNNISIDFVVFGDIEEENTKKLTAFNESVKSSDGSHLAIIPPGPNLLSDSLVTTPILSGEGIAGLGRTVDGEGGEGVSDAYEFGVDPTMDPELALALRMSYEEEQARVEKEKEREKEREKEKERLEGIREEDENAPLLSKDKDEEGEGGASGSGSVGKKDKDEDPDKMDTA